MPLLSQHIIKGCLQKDNACQEEFYRVCYPPMIKVCLRYTRDIDEAGAAYNEAMLKVFNNLSTHRGEGDLMAWVRRIVLNTCLDHWRRQSRFLYEPVEETAVSEIVTIEPEVYNRISSGEVIRLLQELPRNTALVFNLFVFEGYKHDEIGKLLGISGGTSKWHLNEARRLLKIKLDSIFNKETFSNAI